MPRRANRALDRASSIDYSIVIPTYRRRDSLARCLEAIQSLEFDRDRFEVLIVDDGSPTPPVDLVAVVEPSLQARLICARHGGPATARNTGAELARGRHLVFTDDDCMPEPDWLQAIDRLTTDAPDHVALGGRVVNVLPDNLYATASQGIVDYLYEYFGEGASARRFFTTNNLVIARSDFLEVGGFDETFALPAAEDRDLCERLVDAGKLLSYADDVVVRHAHALSFARFTRQHFGYGRGAFDLHRSRAARGSRAFSIEPLRFYHGLVVYPLGRARGLRAVVLALLHAWSQLAYVAGYAYERLRRGWTLDQPSRPRRAHADRATEAEPMTDLVG